MKKKINNDAHQTTTKEEKAREEPWLQVGGRYWLAGKLTAREGQRREQAKNQGLKCRNCEGLKEKNP